VTISYFVVDSRDSFLTRKSEWAKRFEYHEIKVTLHPVVGGNVRTISISREEFLRGNQD
jgi:hypothetical protein